ncbi:uncharacterized protein LOC121414744 [Lytechinus variegatus]|uniref:uncharacterized protein LOC121414744 n=1 Tax=Lytechinus variegatus TaxID=7654 RepID=UPI001BB2195B|nr:uncharacterized protein LOC121414744 [Lytechinus variegatus]
MIGTAFTQNIFVFGALSTSSAICASVLHRQAPTLLHRYFPTNFTFISISTFFGGILGSLLIPLMISLSLMAYGVDGALLILGGIYLNMLPAGYALIVPKDQRKSSVQTGTSGRDDRPTTNGGFAKDTTPLLSKQQKAIPVRRTSKSREDSMNSRPDGQNSISEGNCIPSGFKSNDSTIGEIKSAEGDNDSDVGVHVPNETCTIEKHHLCHLDNIENCKSARKSLNGDISEDHLNISLQSAPDLKEVNESYLIRLIKDIIHFDFLVLNPIVSCTLIPSVGILFFVFGGWDLFEVTYGISQGLQHRTANILPFASTIGCGVSSAFLTVLLRYKPQYCVFLFFVSSCWLTIGFFITTLSPSFFYLLVMSFVVGIGVNGVIVTCEGVIDVVVNQECFADGSTLTDLSIGLGLLLSGLGAGYVQDASGSMKVVYWTLGGMSLVACLLMAVLMFKVFCSISEKK